jgi:5-methylcytosine-specific restriction endonuclease McrA
MNPMESTLLLSATYEPIKVISWKKAVCLMFLEKVDVLEEYTRQVHSPTMALRLPAVVKLHRYVKNLPRRVKFSRQNLYHRDEYTCQYCHKPHPSSQLTYDHVIPRSRGGQTTWTNVVTACIRCNLKKGNKLPHQANLKLLKEPHEPKWLPVFGPHLGMSSAPAVWHTYLNWFEAVPEVG